MSNNAEIMKVKFEQYLSILNQWIGQNGKVFDSRKDDNDAEDNFYIEVNWENTTPELESVDLIFRLFVNEKESLVTLYLDCGDIPQIVLRCRTELFEIDLTRAAIEFKKLSKLSESTEEKSEEIEPSNREGKEKLKEYLESLVKRIGKNPDSFKYFSSDVKTSGVSLSGVGIHGITVEGVDPKHVDIQALTQDKNTKEFDFNCPDNGAITFIWFGEKVDLELKAYFCSDKPTEFKMKVQENDEEKDMDECVYYVDPTVRLSEGQIATAVQYYRSHIT